MSQVEELTILRELERDRQRLNAATSELYRVTLDLRGGISQEGEFKRGTADELQERLDHELIALEERYLEREERLPATDIRAARVNKIVREKHPELWSRFIALEAQEKSLLSGPTRRRTPMAEQIQRYVIEACDDYSVREVRDPHGAWMFVSDHEQALAVADARIRELEAAADRLANAVQKCRVGTGVSGTGLDAALAAYRENGGER